MKPTSKRKRFSFRCKIGLIYPAVRSAPAAFLAWQGRFGVAEATVRLIKASKLALVAFCALRSPSKESERRLGICAECPIFNAGFCGKTGEFIPETDDQFGCWCYLPLAAHLPSKKCWARENHFDFGW